jgi:hypothetical protein
MAVIFSGSHGQLARLFNSRIGSFDENLRSFIVIPLLSLPTNVRLDNKTPWLEIWKCLLGSLLADNLNT